MRAKPSFREKVLRKRKSWQNLPSTGQKTLLLDCGQKVSFGNARKFGIKKPEEESSGFVEETESTDGTQILSDDFSSSEESEVDFHLGHHNFFDTLRHDFISYPATVVSGSLQL